MTTRSRVAFFLKLGMLMMLLGVPVLLWAGVRMPVHAAGSKGHRLGAGLAGTPPPPYCDPTMWHLVPSPNVGGAQSNELLSVSAATTNRVWAVGLAQLSGTDQTLIEEWTGTSWQVVSSPDVQNAGNFLDGVAALTASTAWAVGATVLPSGVTQTLVEEWGGTSWAIVASPNAAGATLSSLSAVAAVSPDDVWAVGSYQNASNIYQTLTEHWNGSAWSIVASPNYADPNYPNDFLRSIVAVSSNDVWAVGYAQDSNLIDTQPVVEHWNGSSWALVTVPIDSTFEFLMSISAVTTKDIWAVGWDTGSPPTSLVMHWNGTQWSIVTSPNVGSTTDGFNAVVAISATNVWAVGDTSSGQSLLEQWNGTVWRLVPNPNNPGGTLSSVSAVNSGDVWTVGSFDNGGGDETRTEQYQPNGPYPEIACPGLP